ncbi:Mbeg1-like protein [uncultured Clostridium sp.]|uniref:Mbeg1-like protein n=1 Tax=uncultured Clostridium sp. TaxID=59620 RepID=UPI0025F5A941|nr:Mbeg1-like protein [uncultured Clostridium sp.]
MCRLSNDEFILIDELIYLEWDAYENESVKELVLDILKDDNLQILMDKMSNCIATSTKEEWQRTLEQILSKPNLTELVVVNVENHVSGMRTASFKDCDGNIIVVFRGTTTVKEWDDNGQGAYEYDTEQQIYALNYVNSINSDRIVVTGHSKGGNKAQYTTVRCPKVIKCVSINGQGFSNEFIKKYKNLIEDNKSKIIAVNSKYDYVNCLLNSIAGESHYIKTSFQFNPLFYHKGSIMLDYDGNLREETSRSIFSKIINDFSTSLVSDLPDDLKSLTIDGLISGIEAILCRRESSDRIIKIIGSILIMMTYGKYFKVKETFVLSYMIIQFLVLPLLFWGDFINVEETHSKELLKDILNKIDKCADAILSRLKLVEDSKNPISRNLYNKFNIFINKLHDAEETL